MTADPVNQDFRNAVVETETDYVMCRTYNDLRRRLTTDYGVRPARRNFFTAAILSGTSVVP